MNRALRTIPFLVDSILDQYDLNDFRYTHDTITRTISSARYIGYQYQQFLGDSVINSNLLPLMYFHALFLEKIGSLVISNDLEIMSSTLKIMLNIDDYLQQLKESGNLYCFVNRRCPIKPAALKVQKDTYCKTEKTMNTLKCIEIRVIERGCFNPAEWDFGHDYAIHTLITECITLKCLDLPTNYSNLMNQYLDSIRKYVDLKYYVSYAGQLIRSMLKYKETPRTEICKYKTQYICKNAAGVGLIRDKLAQVGKNFKWCPDMAEMDVSKKYEACNIISDIIPVDEFEKQTELGPVKLDIDLHRIPSGEDRGITIAMLTSLMEKLHAKPEAYDIINNTNKKRQMIKKIVSYIVNNHIIRNNPDGTFLTTKPIDTKSFRDFLWEVDRNLA